MRAPRAVFLLCAIAAVVTGAVLAAARFWVCDDAFISFRYADNLVRGHGLVFNLGERVEGFTNLAWTLWSALGLRLGVAAETWAGAWGIACFAATLALLAHRGWAIAQAAGASGASGAPGGPRAAGAVWALPAAALLGAIHREWTVFATSGLETSAFTLLAFAGYLLVCPAGGPGVRASPRRLVAAGLVLALASLTRPDGPVFAAVCGVWLVAGRDLRGALALAGGFAALWLPVTIWRIAYYGDLFPNTYYAKSASVAWWSQGAFYARIYFVRYWPLVLAVPCALVRTVRPRRAVALELALAAAYALYVMRVGGDFMFGRLLIPITPFLLLLVERGLGALLGRRPVIAAAAIAGLGIALVVAAPGVAGGHTRRGITDENYVYTVAFPHWGEHADTNGDALARLFDGLPISVGFFGLQARLVYRSRVATAIECETGLTDAAIAHQELSARGRVGHEKHAKLPYLVARRVDFLLTRDWANEVLRLDDQLPNVPIDLGPVGGRVITWDPVSMAALAARGVRVPDVPAQIDAYIAGMASRSDADVRRDFERFRRLYFDRTPDPARALPFRARLGP